MGRQLARLNLELKARDPDPAATAAACGRLGAVDRGVLRQRDTYFRVPKGKLKLRDHLDAGTAELIRYERAEEKGVRASRYQRLDVPPPLGPLLAVALGTIGVVEKTRRLFLHRHVRIHLDDVAGLGTFVELEAVEPPPGDPTLDEVIAALGLAGRETVAAGYLELLGGS